MRSPEHEYTTYPRKFNTYKWYKPLLVGLLSGVFYLISMALIDLLTKLIFGTSVSGVGYDNMDFYSAAGAFLNGAQAAVYVPCLIIAALIVKDRPLSSYFSSMGGWRWKVFLKTLAAAFVILGIPTIAWYLIHGQTGDIKWTAGGFLLLTVFVPLQGLAEEMGYRGLITQTVSSWFMLPIVGVIFQIVLFTSVHPYNSIGRVEIAVSALLYAMACLFSRGIEAPTALHIINNMFEIYLTGFGFGTITAEQNIPYTLFNLGFKLLFVLFILYADRKLHWFDKVKSDDVAAFNAKMGKMQQQK